MRILQSIHSYDLVTFNWCLVRKYRQLMISISRTVSLMADGHLYILFGLGLAATKHYQLLALISGTLLAERTAYFALKTSLRRN
jgi:undecaprenyl-diphosphatase